jgi:hypothetical protein
LAGLAVTISALGAVGRTGVIAEEQPQTGAGRTDQSPVLVEEAAGTVTDVIRAGRTCLAVEVVPVDAGGTGVISSVVY